ncbi:class III extradiol ring-cleavage dioxygenase [Rhodoferax sp.]|uniref:DODA-type extradiol aromatic ring-opening family dioxygenase n=1 Tax=Rhodoferax sp. TaxID=50421 RepID=UPI0026182D68|nr:class III extradiol ring-cleavage dioxygenase [Rhodoferax sp.]
MPNTPTPTHTSARMPTWFIPHGGGPCFFMDWSPPDAWHAMADFLKRLASTLPRTPQAIVVVSAHWLAPRFTVTSGSQPELIYDYHGFPPHTYELKYPAAGAPALANQIVKTLNAAGIASAQNSQRGFDHGVFIPLKLIFPEAHIPVVQLSLHTALDPAQHLAAGRALETLRDQDVLLIGSGMSFHNMRAYGNPAFGPISDAFDAWLTHAVASNPPERDQLLTHWEQAPGARQCHPARAEEHLIPLMAVAGAAGLDVGRKIFSDRVLETTLSAFSFG